MVEAASLRRLIDGHDLRFASALEHARSRHNALPMGTEIDPLLPDGGLARGSVIELSAPNGLGALTRFALTASAKAQEEGRQRCGESSWCAWVDPHQTLYAPFVRAFGVDLERLLVVRSPRTTMSRVAVQLAEARLFSVIVIDVSGVPGTSDGTLAPRTEALSAWVRTARRLALSVEMSKTIVLLITDADAPRSLAIPAAMRIEVGRDKDGFPTLRIAKDRFGRVGGPHRLTWTRPMGPSLPRGDAPPKSESRDYSAQRGDAWNAVS